MPPQDLLDVYLSDHFAGATAGLDLAKRMADTQDDPELAAIAREIEGDRETLRELMSVTGVRPPFIKTALGWLGEKAGRLKLNERLTSRSPLSSVIELEGLITGVSGKLELWRTLGAIAPSDQRLASFDFDRLASRAEDQRRRLEELHGKAVRDALGSSG
jgi:hypothetical protein